MNADKIMKGNSIDTVHIKDSYGRLFHERDGLLCGRQTYVMESHGRNEKIVELAITLKVELIEEERRIFMVYLVDGRLYHCDFTRSYGADDVEDVIQNIITMIPFINMNMHTSFCVKNYPLID